MEVVTGATGSVLTKVGALLQDEYIRQQGVQKDVESLQKELFFMRAALCKVAVVPAEQLDEQVKAWASNVKDLSYDMEDAVDTFTVRVTASKDHGRSRIAGMGKWDRFTARRELADMIAEMKDLTMQVADLRDRYKLDDISVMNTTEQVQEVKEVVSRNFQLWTWWRQCISYRIREVWAGWHRGVSGFILAATGSREIPTPSLGSINGMEDDSARMRDDMKELHDWLNNKNKGGVLYVIGDEGVGKTTVAKYLYHRFGHLFDRRAIVMASSWGHDDKAIVDKIEKQLRLDLKRPTAGETSLRLLLLIDGVESEDTWEKIEEALFKSELLPTGSHSKTIVTTRHSAVASAWKKENGDLKHPQTAGETEEAKCIFMQALGEPTRGDEAEDNIPPRVWEMCAKQPVATIAMAGYAACNRGKSQDAWREVCNKLLPESVKELTRGDIPRVLSHCYRDMSAELETCFLYLSMFKKESSVSRKHLARRWIAEGFVGEKPGRSVEEVADGYFDQLVSRKLVQPVGTSKNSKVMNCQVYGMVHDFIVSQASQENLVTVAGGDSPSPPPNGKVRRLSLSIPASPDEEDPGAGKNMPHVRSLAVFTARKPTSTLPAQRLPSALLSSPIIQVLDLQGCKGVKVTKRHMEVICKMFLLKYLSLRRTIIEAIGRNIERLKNLETLDVRETKVQSLPDTIWKLQKLVNILGGNKNKKFEPLQLKLPADAKAKNHPCKPDGVTMKALRVLSGIEMTPNLARCLERLTNLRKLAIYKVSDTESNKLELFRLGYLRTLVIIAGGEANISELLSSHDIQASSLTSLADLRLCGKLEQVPTWIQELTDLTKLTLPITVLTNPELLAKLANMKKLFSLTFSTPTTLAPAPAPVGTSTTENNFEEIIFDSVGFANLKLLEFIAPLIQPLSFLDNAMSQLERIHLHFTNFQGLHGIHNLRRLQEVHIEVKYDADDFTTSMLRNLLESAMQDDAKAPRITRDWFD
ncbi:disease resistance protein Pik-2-like [Triticum dicoccoides]|uniref:disease resistance protein Pik-2-like n=1 Tax=Triticum dicoccoides TaxID=85692 RepID=UPI001891BEEE|nr:disease resistance protein Pik-2-like [Triticum dicoccoides]